MDVTLTPDLEKLVREKVASGIYNSAGDVVREALRLLQRKEEAERMRLEELRRDLEAGAAQIKQGDYKEYPSAEELIDDIETRGKQRLADRQKGAGR